MNGGLTGWSECDIIDVSRWENWYSYRINNKGHIYTYIRYVDQFLKV